MTNLEKYEYYLKDLESPDHFIRWNFYFLISSCLERRIWTQDFPLYPNLFIVFVGESGFGKSMPAKETKRLLSSLITIENGHEKPLLAMAPDTTSFEKLIHNWCGIHKGREVKFEDNEKRIYTHSSLCICLADEMGTLFRDRTEDLVTLFNKTWDCETYHNETHARGTQIIHNPCVNMLGCCTPEFMGRKANAELFSEGFKGRTIFIFGDRHRQRTTEYNLVPEQVQALNELRKHLVILTRLKPREGGVRLTPEAFEFYDAWVHNRMDKERINLDKKLNHYYGRKRAFLKKLAMVIHFGEKLTWEIELEDMQKALWELNSVEPTMHLALSSVGRNPLNALAEEIKANLSKYESKTEKRLLIEHYDGGNGEAILEVLNYLVNTGQIFKGKGTDGNNIYKLNPESKAENLPEIKPITTINRLKM